jgi:hypothetical protein
VLGLVDAPYVLRALIARGVTSLEAGGDGRVELELARAVAARLPP